MNYEAMGLRVGLPSRVNVLIHNHFECLLVLFMSKYLFTDFSKNIFWFYF